MKKNTKHLLLSVLSAAVLIGSVFSVLADDSIYGTVENGIRSPRTNFMYSPNSKEYLSQPTNLDFSQGFKYWGSSQEGKYPSDLCAIETVDGKTALHFTKVDKTWDGIVCWPFMIESAQEGTNFAIVYDYKGDLAGYEIKLSGEGGWLSGTSYTIVDYEDSEKWNTAVSRTIKSLPDLDDPASVYHFNVHIQYGGQTEDFAPCYFSNFRIVRYSSDKEMYDLSGNMLVFETPVLNTNGATVGTDYIDSSTGELDDGTDVAGNNNNSSSANSDKNESENNDFPIWGIILIIVGGVVVIAGAAVLIIIFKKKKTVNKECTDSSDDPEAENSDENL